MGLHSIETVGDGGFAQHQFVHRDILGTTMALSGSLGAAEALYRTDPWGQVTDIWTPEVDDWATGDPFPTTNHNIYTGHQHDEGTGLIYARARYLDPEIGRFLTQDTYLGEAMNPPNLHRYNYVHGNPTTGVDPTGNIRCEWEDGEVFRITLGLGGTCSSIGAYRVGQGPGSMGMAYFDERGNEVQEYCQRRGFVGAYDHPGTGWVCFDIPYVGYADAATDRETVREFWAVIHELRGFYSALRAINACNGFQCPRDHVAYEYEYETYDEEWYDQLVAGLDSERSEYIAQVSAHVDQCIDQWQQEMAFEFISAGFFGGWLPLRGQMRNNFRLDASGGVHGRPVNPSGPSLGGGASSGASAAASSRGGWVAAAMDRVTFNSTFQRGTQAIQDASVRQADPRNTVILYHGSADNHRPSLVAGVDVRASHAIQDFGQGFYAAFDFDAGDSAATSRSGQGHGEPIMVVGVAHATDLANAVDLRPGSAMGQAWEDFLDEPLMLNGVETPVTNRFAYAQEESRAMVFDTFAVRHNIPADATVIGPMGTGAVVGESQIVSRSQSVADSIRWFVGAAE